MMVPGYDFAPTPAGESHLPATRQLPGASTIVQQYSITPGVVSSQPTPLHGGGMQNLNSAVDKMNFNHARPAPNIFQPHSLSCGQAQNQSPKPFTSMIGGDLPPSPVPQPPSQQPCQLNPNGATSQFYAPIGHTHASEMMKGSAVSKIPELLPVQHGQQQVFEENVDFRIQIPKQMLQLTCRAIPSTAALFQSTKVPCGGILRPLAPPTPDDEQLAVVQPGSAGIIRCTRCRAYVNAGVSWVEHGRRWRCNICVQMNECPSAYFCHLDPQTNLRRDAHQRPELSKSVVEWIAPSEYMVRPPQPPAYFFVLDVSVTAAKSGMLTSAAATIKRALDDLPGGSRTMVGFITYDNAVQYYSLKAGSANPEMMVVGDLKELFVPAPNDLLVNVKDSRAAIDALLENLPTMFAQNKAPTSCLGPALKAAFTVMKSVGGKMCVFLSVMPSLGDGSLKHRENIRLMGTPEEVTLLRPGNAWYKETAIEFSRAQISVDMFLFPYQYIDCAALAELPKYSAGMMFTYVAFHADRDGPKFESQLFRRLIQPTAFESVLRLRCTKGLKINNFYGNYFIRGTDLLALPTCTSDSVFGFDITYESQRINSNAVTIQSALLYTSSDGERRIRVATQSFPAATRASEIISSIDCDTMIALMSKKALDIAIKSNLDNARNMFQQWCLDILQCAKDGDKCFRSGYTVPGHPVERAQDNRDNEIPKHLNLLPLYTLSLIKNVAFRGGTDVHPDERISAHITLNSMSIGDCLHFVHPRMFSVHDIDPKVGMPRLENYDIDGKELGDNMIGSKGILLPQMLNLSVERLSSEGIYLLDNGVDIYLWVGRASDAALIRSLFNCDSLENVDMSTVKLVTNGNDIASRLGAIIHALRQESTNVPPVTPKIYIIREGDACAEIRFFWNLVEDGAQFNGGTYSYMDFMQFVSRGGDGQKAPLRGIGLPGCVSPGTDPTTTPGPPGRVSAGRNYPGPVPPPGQPPPPAALKSYHNQTIVPTHRTPGPTPPLTMSTPPHQHGNQYHGAQTHPPPLGATIGSMSGRIPPSATLQYAERMVPPAPQKGGQTLVPPAPQKGDQTLVPLPRN